MKQILKVFILSLLLSSSLISATINKIEYKNLTLMTTLIADDTLANEAIDLKVGSEITDEKIKKAIRKLYSFRYFKRVNAYFDKSTGVLRFAFKEKPVVSRYELKGLSENLKDDQKREFLKKIGLYNGMIYDKAKEREIRDSFREYYKVMKYLDTVVNITTEKVDEHSIVLNIDINEGRNIIINNTTYVGAKEYSANKIDNAAENRARDFLGWLPGRDGGEASLIDLPYDKSKIRDLYLSDGFLDVEVSDPAMRLDRSNYEANITYKIKEGKRYKVVSYKVKVDRKNISEAEAKKAEADIEEAFTMRLNKNFDVKKLRRDIKKAEEVLGDLGYAYAKATPSMKQDHKKNTADVILNVETGEKVYIRDVIISGNNRTLDRVIRREVFLVPGELYSYTDKMDAENALKRSGFFDKAEITQVKVDDTHTDILVKVEETKTSQLNFGLEYSSYSGFGVMFKATQKNVFGSGLDTSIGVDINNKAQSYDLSIVNPRVNDSLYSLALSTYLENRDTNDYHRRTVGAGARVGRILARNWSTYVGYNIESSRIRDDVDFKEYWNEIKEYYPEMKRNDFMKRTNSVVSTGVNYDDTNDYWFPTAGKIGGVSAAYAGVGGNVEYTKFDAYYKHYINLYAFLDYDVIFRYKFDAGVLIPRGTNGMDIDYRYYYGGSSTLRGYEWGSVSPKRTRLITDRITHKKVMRSFYVGGKKGATATAELAVPLTESHRLNLALFYDFGTLGVDSYTEVSRMSAGLNLVWVSPIGPLMFTFPRAINAKDDDRTSNFEFNIGKSF